MSKKLYLKEILLTKLNSILNPDFHKKFISGLLFLGTTLAGAPLLTSILGKAKYESPEHSLTLELIQSNNDILILIGATCISLAIILFIKERYFNTPKPSEFLGVSHYICKSYELLIEISKDNFSKFPIDNPIFLKTEVFNSLKEIIDMHPYPYRRCGVDGDSFSNIGQYTKIYKDAFPPNKNDGEYSYFEIMRQPKLGELKRISHEDGILKLMLEEEINIDGISLAGCYRNGCGGGDELNEEYIFRELWCVFLAIENTHDKPVILKEMESKIIQSSGFSVFKSNGDRDAEGTPILPKGTVQPGKTVIIPTVLILPPLYPLETETESLPNYDKYWDDKVQTVSRESIIINNLNDLISYKTQLIPRTIEYKIQGNIYHQAIHSLDLTNVYSIDRDWMIGSCPHLFFQINEEICYKKELLANCELVTGNEVFHIPRNVTSFIIAEIEDELTEIEYILINNNIHEKNIVLHKSEYIKIPVSEHDMIEVRGKYTPYTSNSTFKASANIRNKLVGNFLKSNNWKSPNKSIKNRPANSVP